MITETTGDIANRLATRQDEWKRQRAALETHQVLKDLELDARAYLQAFAQGHASRGDTILALLAAVTDAEQSLAFIEKVYS